MLRKIVCLALCSVSWLSPARGYAQTAVLLAVGQPSRLSEVQLVKVMADESSLWLSVRVRGSTRIALVTAESAVEAAPAAHAWLQALDFATRVRVAAPLGSLPSCGAKQRFEPDDTGLPEVPSVAEFETSTQATELELRRRLADAGLAADAERVAQFTSATPPPFRVALYDVSAGGGSTKALRLLDRGHANELPRIAFSGASSVSLSLIALAKEGVQPLSRDSADPSEFPVVYRAFDGRTDYLSARSSFLGPTPERWLNEVQATAPLFAGTALPSGQPIESVMSRYFAAARGASASACEARVRAAHERASANADDFVCDGADDLARSLSEVDFSELRSSRFFGRLGVDGAEFRVVESGTRSPLLFATDLDSSGCPPEEPLPVIISDSPSRQPPMSTPPVVVSVPDDPYGGSTQVTTSVSSEESCTGTAASSGSNDSCNGDSSSSESTRDSCSGDSSSGESSRDSCSGDSSSSESSDDSCSGDSSSSDSSRDSCSGDSSDSKYDGDTCSGNAAESHSTRAESAQLRADPRPRNSAPSRLRRRPIRLSLVTLLAATLALPLRRRCASR